MNARDWPSLDSTLSEHFDQLALRRTEVGSTETGKRLRLRIASMGDAAGRLMARYLLQLQYTRIFEIGTCAGIGAAYMCSAAERNGRVTFHGLEGVEEKRQIAQETLDLFCPNTEATIHPGHFDDSFEPALAAASPLQFVYLDGRHKREPSIKMFNRCVEEMPDGGVIVCDDLDHQAMGDCRKKFTKHPRTVSTLAFAKKVAFTIGATK